MSAAVVRTFDAQTGIEGPKTVGASIPLGGEAGFDLVQPAFTPNGQYLALLHSTSYVTEAPPLTGTKPSPPVAASDGTFTSGPPVRVNVRPRVVRHSVELISLASRLPICVLPLSTPGTSALGGQLVYDSVFDLFHTFIQVTAFEQQISTLKPDAVAPELGLARSLRAISGLDDSRTVSMLWPADGRKLLRFTPPYQLEWIDVGQAEVVSTFALAPDSAGRKGYAVLPLRSPMSAMLYLLDTFSDVCHIVDPSGSRETGSRLLGSQNPGPRLGPQPAVASSFWPRLYAVDPLNQNIVRVFEVPGLTPLARWDVGMQVGALYEASDGQVLFCSNTSGGLVAMLDASGRVLGRVPTDHAPSAFVP